MTAVRSTWLAWWNGHPISGAGDTAGDKGLAETTAASAGLTAKHWDVHFLECVPWSHCTRGTGDGVMSSRRE